MNMHHYELRTTKTTKDEIQLIRDTCYWQCSERTGEHLCCPSDARVKLSHQPISCTTKSARNPTTRHPHSKLVIKQLSICQVAQ